MAAALKRTGTATLDLRRNRGFFEFDAAAAKAAGQALRDDYATAEPYPHHVFDQLLDSQWLLRVNAEFPRPQDGRFNDGFSQKKTGYSLDKIDSPIIVELLNALNSAAFLGFLEELTGIYGLIPDPHFTGGGLHETRRGGLLRVHSDFNIHPHLGTIRRLNLILFLNEGWDEDWGGKLELWDRRMTRMFKAILPEIGKAVVFNTDAGNNHGHPDPLECPADVPRRSIALYYYTAQSARKIPQTTIFRARPGTNDETTSIASRLRYAVTQLARWR